MITGIPARSVNQASGTNYLGADHLSTDPAVVKNYNGDGGTG